MESPPQYPGAPKRNKTGQIIGIIALAVVLCCCGCGGALFYFGKGAFQGGVGMVGCQLSLQMHREALLAYAEKHGGKLPPANNWQDDVKPYIQRDKSFDDPDMPFKIPGANDDFCDKEGKSTITYNAAYAGKKLDSIKEGDKSTIPVLFETPGNGRNLSAPWSEPPYNTSPVVVAGQRRGWIRIALEGEAELKDQTGRVRPIKGSRQFQAQ